MGKRDALPGMKRPAGRKGKRGEGLLARYFGNRGHESREDEGGKGKNFHCCVSQHELRQGMLAVER